MAHSQSSGQIFVNLASGFKRLRVNDPVTQCLLPRQIRSYATVVEAPIQELAEPQSSPSRRHSSPAPISSTTALAPSVPSPATPKPVYTTLHTWPTLSPHSLLTTPLLSATLTTPLRRDLLHRAVVYEGDNTRQGTASTKWRDDVRGSSHKIRPQKGSGMARLSDKKNPMLRGGGVAHGPHPRDFGTDLPRKVYDTAWRAALSYKYTRGELVVVRGKIEVPAAVRATADVGVATRWLNNLFAAQQWGKGAGKSLLITAPKSEDDVFVQVMTALEKRRRGQGRYDRGEKPEEPVEWAMWRDTNKVDVKNLLEAGRVVVEEAALKRIMEMRGRDLII